MYVIQMGWDRWGKAARIKWAIILRKACEETIELCDQEIRHEQEEI